MLFLISLDELDIVKRRHHIKTISDLAEATQVSRPTWTKAIKSRRPTPDILNALADLGARPDRVLVLAENNMVAA